MKKEKTNNIIEFFMKKVKKHGFWGLLVRKNTGVSSLSFFLIAVTLAGLGLLALVAFVMIWEVVHNNTITSDLSGWATFIGSISALFASAGITKGWSNWSENKFNANKNNQETEEPTSDDDID